MSDLQNFIKEVKSELRSLQELINIDDSVFNEADKLTEDEMNMSVSDAADMCVDLSL